MERRAFTDRRDLYNGFGDSLARAVEIVTTPMIFGLLGWWIDGRLHTRPVFMLTLGVLVTIYTLWKLSKGYMSKMDEETRKVVPRER